MKKFSKLVSLLVVLVMVTATLVACGNKGAEEETTTAATTKATEGTTAAAQEETTAAQAEAGLTPEAGATLKVWESSDASGTFIQEAAKQFEAKYGVVVSFENVESGDTANKIILDGPNGTGADVFVAPHDKLGQLVSAGVVLDNDMAGYDANNFLEAALTATSYEGKQIGYPLALDGYALFYNKDLITEVPATWDDVIAFASSFNDSSSNKYAMMWDVGNAYYAYAFVGHTGNLFGDNGSDASIIPFDTPAAIDALKYYNELRTKIYDVNSADATYDAGKAAFMEGNCAMTIDGTWNVGTYKDAGLNVGVAEIPSFGASKSVSFTGVRGLYVSSYTQYPIAAKMFADFCANELAGLRYEMTGMISASKTVTGYNDIDNGFMAQFSHAFPMPSIPEMAGFWNSMPTAFANIWDGKDVQTEISGAITAIKESSN